MKQAEYIIEQYILWRANPINDSKQDTSFASQNSISSNTLQQILSDTKTDWRSKVLDTRREHYKSHMLEIDKAIMCKAKSGDVRAAELLYRRFDNWNPKLIEVQDNRKFTFLDIIKKIDKDGIISRAKKRFRND